MQNLKANIQYSLIFILSFVAGLYFLGIFTTDKNSAAKNINDPIHEYSKLPSDVVELNGKKIKVFSGLSNLSASELISKMKEDISSNSKLKLIHSIGDLWGPLLLTTLLAVTLFFNNNDKQSVIVLVFFVFWFGGVVITINAQALGAKM